MTKVDSNTTDTEMASITTTVTKGRMNAGGRKSFWTIKIILIVSMASLVSLGVASAFFFWGRQVDTCGTDDIEMDPPESSELNADEKEHLDYWVEEFVMNSTNHDHRKGDRMLFRDSTRKSCWNYGNGRYLCKDWPYTSRQRFTTKSCTNRYHAMNYARYTWAPQKAQAHENYGESIWSRSGYKGTNCWTRTIYTGLQNVQGPSYYCVKEFTATTTTELTCWITS